MPNSETGMTASGGKALKAACALALAGGFASSPASAGKQAPLIPDWKQSHLQEGGGLATESIYKLAVCAKRERRQAAEALLASAPGSAQENAMFHAAFPSGWTTCPIRSTRVAIRSRVLARGAIAESIYNGGGFKPRAASLPLTEAFQPSRYGSELVVARWVARCAVRREPRVAHQVVQWIPGGMGEERALHALKPTFLACLPSGERLQMSRLNMRALLAEELYHASVTFKESFTHAEG